MPKYDEQLCRERYGLEDFTGTMGMVEMELGLADIMNKALDAGCKLRDVRFSAEDLESDPDAFRELLENGWLVESHGRYRLDEAAVDRVHQRFPHA